MPHRSINQQPHLQLQPQPQPQPQLQLESIPFDVFIEQISNPHSSIRQTYSPSDISASLNTRANGAALQLDSAKLRSLFQHGADPNLVLSLTGQHLICYLISLSISSNFTEKLLLTIATALDHNASISTKTGIPKANDLLSYALSTAHQLFRPYIISMLISHGAEINGIYAYDTPPETLYNPLYHCVVQGLIEEAVYLLDRGANPNIKPDRIRTLLEINQEEGNPRNKELMADLLIKYGAGMAPEPSSSITNGVFYDPVCLLPPFR